MHSPGERLRPRKFRFLRLTPQLRTTTMTHYEARLEGDLVAVRGEIRSIADLVRDNLRSAAQAFQAHDKELAADTILRDMRVNRRIRNLDADCHAFVARHWPGARHLRFVSSVLRVSVALERIGDYAASICRETVQLEETCAKNLSSEIKGLLQGSVQLLEESIAVFTDRHGKAARSVVERAASMGGRFDQAFEDLARFGETGARVRDLMAMLVILNRVSRVRAQAKNIAEEALFVHTGETKAPKVYEILFVDQRNDLLGPLAQACALKAFPQSGHYETAGVEPSARLSSLVEELTGKHGITLGTASPQGLAEISDMERFHVIVILERLPVDDSEPPPFHTVLVNWNLDPGTAPEKLLEEISGRLNTLMVTMRGDRAS